MDLLLYHPDLSSAVVRLRDSFDTQPQQGLPLLGYYLIFSIFPVSLIPFPLANPQSTPFSCLPLCHSSSLMTIALVADTHSFWISCN